MRNTGRWSLTNMIQNNPRNTIDKPVEMTGLELLEVSLHWKLQSSCLMLLLFTLPCYLSLMITTERQRSSSLIYSWPQLAPSYQALILSLLVFLLLLSSFMAGVALILSVREVLLVFLLFWSSLLFLFCQNRSHYRHTSTYIINKDVKNSYLSNMVDWILQEQGIGAQLMELLNGLVFVNFSTIQHH